MQATGFAKRLAQDTRGATMIEYSLLGALIALVLVGALQSIGNSTNVSLTTAADGMEKPG